MTRSIKRDSAMVRRIAKEFIDNFYPTEVSRFQITWYQFLESTQAQDPKKSNKIQESVGKQLRRLDSTDKQAETSVARHVLNIIDLTLGELQATVPSPSVEVLGEAVRKCAHVLGAPNQLCEELATSIPVIILAQTQELNLQVDNTVDQSGATVLVPSPSLTRCVDSETIISGLKGEQSPVLFREFLRRGSMHWSEAFLVYERWNRKIPKEPKNVFKSRVSDINVALRKMGVPLSLVPEKQSRRENTGRWGLHSDKSLQLVGEIHDSKALLSSAIELEGEGDIRKATSDVLEAHRLDPENADILLMLARLVLNEEQEPSIFGADPIIRVGLSRHASRLHSAQSTLQNFIGQGPADIEVRMTIARIQNEWPLVRKSELLLEKAAVEGERMTDDDLHFRILHEQIVQLREIGKEKECIELSRQILMNEHMQEVLDRGVANAISLSKKLRGYLFPEILRTFAQSALYQLCLSGRQVIEYPDLRTMKSKWAFAVGRKAVSEAIHEKSGVSPSDQGRVNRLERHKKELEEAGMNASDTDLAEKTGKSLEEIQQIELLRRQMYEPINDIDLERTCKLPLWWYMS